MSIDQNLSQKAIDDYRSHTYRYLTKLRLKNSRQAVNFVNERGFIFFWPNKGIELPSLWSAATGNRPVPNNHDDPGHITWNWKDEQLEKKNWYYGRILCRRNTIISLRLLPYFYALSPNYGSPEEDYLIEYQQGKLSQEEKTVYETILDKGALNTFALRKESHLRSSENTSRFNRALDNLQRDFRILPVGIADSGAWHYSFIYDATHRAFPELIKQSHPIKKSEAMQEILQTYFLSVGVAQLKDIARIFHWDKQDIQRRLKGMIQDAVIKENISIEGYPGTWFAVSSLLS